MSGIKSLIIDPKSVIGKSEEEAYEIIKDKVVFRIVQRDGVDLEIDTVNFPFRWNFYVKDNIVIDIKFF